MTLTDTYRKAIAEKKSYPWKVFKAEAIGIMFVAAVTIFLYGLDPWLSVLGIALGVIVFFWARLDGEPEHYPRCPWQHPLHDRDLSELNYGNVLFSRWDAADLQILLEENGQLIETTVEGCLYADREDIVPLVIISLNDRPRLRLSAP